LTWCDGANIGSVGQWPEQRRSKVARERRIWIVHRQPFMAHMLERIGFLDEIWLTTNMTKTTGWAPRGQTQSALMRQLIDNPKCSVLMLAFCTSLLNNCRWAMLL
jgi:hypothetical protein